MNLVQQIGSARVLRDMNIRSGAPNTTATPVPIKAGKTVAFVGYVTDGESVNGNAKWYKTADNNYFWSGNVEVVPNAPVTPPKPTTTAFLALPIKGNDDTGKPLTPCTARISAVLDHAGTSLDSTCKTPFSWGLRAKDRKVIAFNGEVGDGASCTTGPFGYAKNQPGPFFAKKEINYVGVYDMHDKYAPSWYLNYDGHCGYDFSYPVGTPILAPADGDLSKALLTDPVDGTNKQATAWDGFHTFYIDHRNGFFTWFLHATNLHHDIEKVLQTAKPAPVTRGQTIAYLGKVGTPGAHLHFEVRDKNNRIIDPYTDRLWL